MYKLVIRYFGELCSKEKRDDIEVYDEDIIKNENKKELEKIQNNYIQDSLKDGYVLDKEEQKICRLFFGEQENWNNYIEMFFEEV